MTTADTKTQRALLPGRSGFTGRYVAAELEAAGYEVISSRMTAIPQGKACCAPICSIATP